MYYAQTIPRAPRGRGRRQAQLLCGSAMRIGRQDVQGLEHLTMIIVSMMTVSNEIVSRLALKRCPPPQLHGVPAQPAPTAKRAPLRYFSLARLPRRGPQVTHDAVRRPTMRETQDQVGYTSKSGKKEKKKSRCHSHPRKQERNKVPSMLTDSRERTKLAEGKRDACCLRK